MKALVQRVLRARVTVDGQVTGEIARGLLVFLGVGGSDTEEDVDYLAGKIAGLRIFEDAAGLMNVSVAGIGGSLLVVSQFTLYGETRKGQRPSFSRAASPELARRLYDLFLVRASNRGVNVQAGRFQARMEVELVNDGPVTLLIESPAEWRDQKYLTKESTMGL